MMIDSKIFADSYRTANPDATEEEVELQTTLLSAAMIAVAGTTPAAMALSALLQDVAIVATQEEDGEEVKAALNRMQAISAYWLTLQDGLKTGAVQIMTMPEFLSAIAAAEEKPS
jgi:hypothetical protein